MKISVSATNPCHLFHLARELSGRGALGAYYSGYPRWKLDAPASMPIRTHSLRTLAVYGLLRLPPVFRPAPRSLFLWQDRAFDHWVGSTLNECDFLHAMPGQCLRTFESARRLGIRTVLNHATGPVSAWLDIMRPEYERAGLDVARVSPFDARYLDRERREYALADFHCAASSVVRDQLAAAGVPRDRIWVVPYGADPTVFHPRGARRPEQFTIVFAGQFGLRKGARTLLAALESAGARDWRVDFYGALLPEAEALVKAYRGAIPLKFHGPVSQAELAQAFRSASVLVLPSLEEGFGLVVPQALNCGLPCIVSDRTGARDLIENHVNGSIVAINECEALRDELLCWEQSRKQVDEIHDWTGPANRLMKYSTAALA